MGGGASSDWGVRVDVNGEVFVKIQKKKIEWGWVGRGRVGGVRSGVGVGEVG